MTGPQDHFINSVFPCNSHSILFHFALTRIIMTQLLQIVAHDMAAVLSGEIQK